MDVDDNKKLFKILANDITSDEEKFAASVLLKNKSMAENHFELLSLELKVRIEKYPIYTLYKSLED